MTRDPLNIGVRLTPELHAALSAEVSRRTAADPDAGWTLSSVARSILRVALLGRAAVPLDANPAELRPVEAPSARAEVGTAAVQTSEPPCAACGEGLWHHCTRHCGRRTRTCVCAESIALDGVCQSCAQSPATSAPVGLALTPPPEGRSPVPPDEVQESARVEVRAWLGAVEGRKALTLALAAGVADQNVRRWLNPVQRQRLRASTIDAILAHVRGNP